MNDLKQKHPDLEQLEAFGVGRLEPAALAEIEQHVAHCDTCCQALQRVADDTFVGLARQAAAAAAPASPTEVAAAAGPTPSAAANRAGRPLAPAVPLDAPPQLADHPRYRIVQFLGAGGMGVVYKAEHRIMERPVALKVISRELVANPKAIERFRQEVRTAARLNHPNIVTAHDAEQAGDLHFLVMEFVEGISLARLVEKKGPLPVHQACHCVRQTALGLQHAHERGMVHRDIKPHNLMVNRKGQVKILDFGLARFACERGQAGEPSGAAAGITATDVVLGTPDYLAPEQARNSSSVDIRADLYSLGCTFYYLLTGKVPFEAETALDKLLQHSAAEPPSLAALRPDVPPEVVTAVQRLMAKRPEDRYQTPADVAGALAPFTKSPAPSVEVPLPLGAAPNDRNTLPEAGADYAARRGDTPPPFRPKSRRSPAAAFARRHWRPIATVYAVGFAIVGALILWAVLSDEGGENRLSKLAPPELRPSGTGRGTPPADGRGSGGLTKPSSQQPLSPAPLPGAGLRETRPAPAAAQPTARRPRQVLFVLAAQGFHYPDYHPVRTLLEANRVKVIVASSKSGEATPDTFGGQPVAVDLVLSEARAADYEAVIFCGGPGVGEFFEKNPGGPAAKRLVQDMLAANKRVTALCFGPAALAETGVLKGKKATCWKGNQEMCVRKLLEHGAEWVDEPVVVDGLIITGRDPQSAEKFATILLEQLNRNR